MNVRYRVELSQTEREELTAMLGGGKRAARKLMRAHRWRPMEAAGRGDLPDRERQPLHRLSDQAPHPMCAPQ
jgi:hypothetical protein